MNNLAVALMIRLLAILVDIFDIYQVSSASSIRPPAQEVVPKQRLTLMMPRRRGDIGIARV